ncbi:MAG: response regulator [candidate division NC10 bacterium]|nr:response regulator [candidate division NC10 bacterium]
MRTLRALVAEDEAAVRRLCGRILEGMGYQTVMASHGLEALKAAEGEPFEIVVADIRMPDLDGIELLKSIKKMSPETEVIVITGYATLENAIEALREGAADYIRKPFSANELQGVIQKCEKRRRSAEERSHLREILAIHELSLALGSTRSLEQIMGLFLELAARAMRSGKALLLLLEGNTGMLRVAACKGFAQQAVEGLRVPLGETALGHALAKEKPSLVEHLAEDPLLAKLSENGKSPRSLLCAPLVTRGKIMGGLLLYPRENGEPFSPGEERALSIMAYQAAIAVENAQLLESHQRRVVELTKIHEMASMLESPPDEATLLSSLAQSLQGLVDHEIFALLAPVSGGWKLTILTSVPLTEGLQEDLREKMMQELRRVGSGQAEVSHLEVNLSARDLAPQAGPPARLGSTFMVPLTIGEAAEGVIAFVRGRDEPFDQVSIKALQIAARILSSFLRNRRFPAGDKKEYLPVVRALSAMLEAKDPATRDHSFYTAKVAKALALKLGLPAEEVDQIIVAALLHDLGKIGISESILGKAGELSPQEQQGLQRHPAIGARILESVDLPWDLRPLILSHHERFDGTGYPSGLKGQEIPLGARILSLADAYEMMIAGRRPDQKTLSRSEAAQELMQCSGTHFDPQLIPPFLEVLGEAGED